jgi:hypothetical protein
LGIRIFFLEKKTQLPPPWKLNGPFLKTLSEKAIIAVIVIVAKQKKI